MNAFPLISASLVLSGILHFVTAPERFQHASVAVGALYIILGVFQLLLAVGVYTSHKTMTWARIILISCLFLFVLFVLNQVFGGQVSLFVKESYSLPTVLRKIFEIIAVVCAFQLIQKQKKST